jgi:hypothetical protein
MFDHFAFWGAVDEPSVHPTRSGRLKLSSAGRMTKPNLIRRGPQIAIGSPGSIVALHPSPVDVEQFDLGWIV